jgi:hypothetical protein
MEVATRRFCQEAGNTVTSAGTRSHRARDDRRLEHSRGVFMMLEFGRFLVRVPSARRATENSPGLQPWERHAQGNRPERASEWHRRQRIYMPLYAMA